MTAGSPDGPGIGAHVRKRIGVETIGRNEDERLLGCLASVDAPCAPVIYVDSGSTDGSSAAARALGARVVELDMARPFSALRARNAGREANMARQPNLEFVQFVDGDCEFRRGWRATTTAFLDRRAEVAVVCGRRRERLPEASFYNRIRDAEWNTPIGEGRACGGDALMRAFAILVAGGFDANHPAGEEPELCHRLRQQGWQVWRIDTPMTIHDAAMHRFRQWWLRAVRSGLGYAQALCVSRGRHGPLYRRECLRALARTLGVTALAVAAALKWGWPALLILGLQFMRLAVRHRPGEDVLLLLLLGRMAETIGIATYIRPAIAGRAGGTIF